MGVAVPPDVSMPIEHDKVAVLGHVQSEWAVYLSAAGIGRPLWLPFVVQHLQFSIQMKREAVAAVEGPQASTG